MAIGEIPNKLSTSQPRQKSSWARIPLLLVLVLVSASAWQAYAPFGPFIINEFKLSKAQFGLVGMMNALGGLFSSVIFGLVVDRISSKKGILLVFGLQIVICSAIYYTKTYQGLIVLLFLLGMVYIAITPLTNKIIFRIIPPGYRVTAIGMKQSMIPAGSAATAIFLPMVAMRGNWRNGYLMLAVLLALMTILCYFMYREDDPPRATPITKEGSLPAKRAGFFTAGLAATMLMGMSFTVSMSSMISFLMPFSHEYLGMSVLKASSYLATLQFGGAFFRIVFGFFSDRFFRGRRKWELTILMLSNSVLLFIMGTISPGINDLAFYVLCLLLGISTMAWYSAYFALAIDQLGEDRAGFASGLAATFTILGTSLGPMIFGLLTDTFKSFSPTFTVISGWMLLAGIAFSLAPIKEHY